MARDHLPSLIRVRDRLFASGRRTGTFECVACDAPSLEVSLEVFEGRGTLSFECRSCGFLDHVSRLSLPTWAAE